MQVEFRTTVGDLPRTQIQAAVAARLKELFPRWKPSLSNSEMNVIIILRANKLLFGIEIVGSSISMSQIKGRSYAKTVLRPSIAWGICKMAKISPGESILDPMCG